MLKTLLFTGAFLLGSYATFGQTELWSESFEDDGTISGPARYTVSSQFYGGTSDYFGRVDAQTLIYQNGNTPTANTINVSASNYLGTNGSFYMAGEDTDDTGPLWGVADGLDEKIITFTGIDISGGTSLTFTGLFARGETSGCTASAYDSTDYIRVYCQVDTGSDNLILQFSPNISGCGGGNFNQPLYSDPNFDNDGADGVVLTNTLTEFTTNIPNGTSANIRIEVHMDSDIEEIAFDYLRVISNNPLGTSNESLEKGIQMYPNPSKGTIQLKKAIGLALASLKVYNLLGDEVKHINLADMGSTKLLNLTNLASGIYITKIQAENGTTLANKIVIE